MSWRARNLTSASWRDRTPTDITGPVLTAASAEATSESTATLSVTTNEARGRLYWFVSTSSTAPTALNLKAGTGAVTYSSQSVAAVGAQSASASGLAASTDYYAHFIHRDASGNDGAIVTSDVFGTSGAPGQLDFSGAAQSGLLILLEDI